MKRHNYEMKAVIFDIQEACPELKRELGEAGIITVVPFFGTQIEETLQGIFEGTALSLEDCLMLTNDEQHAKVARKLGMAVAGCIEGHFEVPKSVTLLEEPGLVSVGYLNQVFCHEQQKPATIFETERCIVREMTEEDAERLLHILTEKEVAEYLESKTGSKEEELDKIKSYVSCVYSFFGYGYWGVFSKRSNQLIGRAGFKEGSYPPEVGYVIEHSLWGHGLATEIVTELLQYAKEELDSSEVLAKVDAENKASRRVLEKCGFQRVETTNTSEEQKKTERTIYLYECIM